ncbi:unnamed protein product, partial [Brugia pahangi]|uniref:Alpha-amylase_C domain-containing protein n=1 Tax=Brugia pahangi TaxID=6280 RepID=A0A0N4TG76_BRUPA
FPVGYAQKYGIRLKGPKDTGIVKYLNFIRIYIKFKKIGAKLEATDMCEPHLICPATVAGHHGRLLRIEYDGWASNYDQLFDYRYNIPFQRLKPNLLVVFQILDSKNFSFSSSYPGLHLKFHICTLSLFKAIILAMSNRGRA